MIDEFEQALSEYRAGDWEKVGLKAGKFCEVAYCVCSGHVTGSFASTPNKPNDFKKSCLDLEAHNKTKGRSLCIQIPRILLGLYELRNNRSIGHIGGDVSPNHMDAEFFLSGMKWVLAEFVRFFSRLPLDDSRALIEAVTARTFPIIWNNGDARRILDPVKTTPDKVLILLYSEKKPTPIRSLQNWIEYKNTTEFKTKVIIPLHKKALVHFDIQNALVSILPPGQSLVEKSGMLIVSTK
nr:hypothetical protein [Methylobacterium sp. ZNC0032]